MNRISLECQKKPIHKGVGSVSLSIYLKKKKEIPNGPARTMFDGFIAKKAACRNFSIVFETTDSGPVSHRSITMTKITHHLADFTLFADYF